MRVVFVALRKADNISLGVAELQIECRDFCDTDVVNNCSLGTLHLIENHIHA